MPFINWKTRLDVQQKFATVLERRNAIAPLKINFSQPTENDEGYYRKPVIEKQPNGQNRVIDRIPVAYFLDNGKLVCLLGAGNNQREVSAEDEDLWSYVVGNPIPYEWYQAVAENGEPWPDSVKPLEPAIPAANREVTSADNQPPEDVPLDVQHRERIENAVKMAEDLQATNAVSAAIVLGAKNRLAELRLAADKAGRAIYEPLHAVYVAEQKKWPGMVKQASDMEKKLNQRYLLWQDAENKRLAEIKRIADVEQAEIDEANARAADRAIARGEPEPAPAVPEQPPAQPAPAPVAATYRAPGQRTKPVAVEKWHIDGIDDFAKVYEFFKDNADVKAALLKVATAAITNGQEVPGTRRHFGLI